MPNVPPCQRILIVDDDDVMRQLLQLLLPVSAFEVREASSGSEASEMLRNGAAMDVVLTDLQMPGVQGQELARLLRAEMPGEAVLLAMSAREPAPELRAAVDGFLLKPFDVETLEQAVAEARARRAPSPAREVTRASPESVGPEGAPAGPVLNETIFGSLVQLIPREQLGALYEMTIADILKRHSRMVSAAAAGDLVTVKQEAHATKGSCGMVGAQELQSLCAELEGGTTVNTATLQEIPEACERLRDTLQGKLK